MERHQYQGQYPTRVRCSVNIGSQSESVSKWVLSFVLRTLRKEALLGITEVTENTHYWKMLLAFGSKLKKIWGGEKTGKEKEAVVKKRGQKSNLQWFIEREDGKTRIKNGDIVHKYFLRPQKT